MVVHRGVLAAICTAVIIGVKWWDRILCSDGPYNKEAAKAIHQDGESHKDANSAHDRRTHNEVSKRIIRETSHAIAAVTIAIIISADEGTTSRA